MPEIKLGRWLRRRRRRAMFVAVQALLRVLGFDGARGLGAVLGELLYRVQRRKRLHLARHMALALGRPEGDPQVAEQLRHAYRVNTGAVLEVLCMFDRRQDLARMLGHCEVSGVEHLQAALAQGRGAILLGSHAGNGALLALKLAQAGYGISVVTRQSRMMSGEFFERGFAMYGAENILANKGIKAYTRMLGALRRGRIVMIMLDQGCSASQGGLPTRFLGKQVSMPAGPAQLARHGRAPLLPVATVGATPAWQFAIEPPVPTVEGSTLEEDFELLIRITERQIRANPQLWSWQQRRWRKEPWPGA